MNAFVLTALIAASPLTVWATCNDALSAPGTNLSVNAIYDRFLDISSLYLLNHLRWPDEATSREMLESVVGWYAKQHPDVEGNLNVSLEALAPYLKDANAEFRSRFPERYILLRKRLATAFVRAVRQTDLPKEFRSLPRTPSLDLLFLAVLKAKSNRDVVALVDYVKGEFTIEHLKDLLFSSRQSERSHIFPQPLIFPEGFSELETAARFESPGLFSSYIDDSIITYARAESTVHALERSNGFIVTSWTSGKRLNEDFLQTLLALAEEKNYVLLVIPTQQNFEHLPSIFLNHPRIHLLTHTLENDTLKISNEILNPDSIYPLGQLKKSGRFKPGQTVIAAHPHAMLEILPSISNGVAPVTLVATGSLNDPSAVFSGVSRGASRESNKGYWKRRAWIFDKADGQSVFDIQGPKNIWHKRPVSFVDDTAHNGNAGFIDLSKGYYIHTASDGTRAFKKTEVLPDLIYLGDFHDPVTDPVFVKAVLEDLEIPTNANLMIVTGDLFDNGVISPHAFGRLLEQNLAYQRDGRSLQKQLNSVIQVVNAFLHHFPNARWGNIIGNHEEWLTRMLQNAPEVDNVINGDLLDELSFVVKTFKFNVWEYIFKYREQVLNTVLVRHPDKKAEILRRLIPVYDPERIEILDRDTFLKGPPHRKNGVGGHGDRASFGKKNPSLKEFARGMPEGGGIRGHSHSPGMYDEVIDVGTMGVIDPEYGRGYHSGVGQGLGLHYPDGTKQLLIFNRQAGTFVQRPGAALLKPERFFDSPSFRIQPNDNANVDTDQVLQLTWGELERLKRMIGN